MSNFKDFDLDLRKVSSSNDDEPQTRTIITTISLIGACDTMPNLTITRPCCQKDGHNIENDVAPRCQ
ncbi:FDLD family class I lanthipeptide [Clostridioides sp. ZZV15-6383]|uniref:FDLD family class I lanthipeptide n=1 Tax=Clostridioides sp. ZZV15-6383 TaxID=2811498 RepID=UPI001D11E3D7|nr:FDLD family class I lanthipeptide [Clostridioides sp. ZZV15-6383]